jgi:predicted metal-dependent hydrolase
MQPAICEEAPPRALLAGIDQFNLGEYYNCHDTLEEMWMAETRPIRNLYKGILQIGVAFYHLEHKRYRPTVTLLQRGCGYVRPFAPACLGLDLAQLLADAENCLDKVRQLGRDKLHEFDWSEAPTIRYEECS